MHSLKTWWHISESLDEMVTDDNDLHPQNISEPIFVTDDGISIDFNEVQPKKAHSPIRETDEGILNDFNELHS